MKASTTVRKFASAVIELANEHDEAVQKAEWYRTHSARPHGREKANRPAPRLEFEHVPDPDWYRTTCFYWMVIPLKDSDIRRERDGKAVFQEWYVPLGSTTMTGGRGEPPIYEGKVNTPFRDGAHAHFDREALGLPSLPIWAVCGDVATETSKENARSVAQSHDQES